MGQRCELWVVLADYQPHQLGTVIRDQLQGSAAVLGREYSQMELIQGRTLITGQVQDTVTDSFRPSSKVRTTK